jgi:hypothetical protein
MLICILSILKFITVKVQIKFACSCKVSCYIVKLFYTTLSTSGSRSHTTYYNNYHEKVTQLRNLYTIKWKKNTVSNSNRQIVENVKIETPNKDIHEHPLSWLCTGTSIISVFDEPNLIWLSCVSIVYNW